MSELKVNSIDSLNGTDEVIIPTLDKRFVSAWVNFNGTGTVSIRDSYNVSSITDNGVGDYDVNFTDALANTNYVMCGSGSDGSHVVITVTKLTTDINIQIRASTTANLTDISIVDVAIFGGQ